MPVLTDPQRARIAAEFMRRLSGTRTGTGVLSKADMRSIVDAMDTQLDVAETAVVTTFLPNSDIRDWLVANPSVGRRGLAQIEEFRRSAL